MNKGEVEDSSLTACIQENTLLSLDGPSPLDINIIVYLNKTVGYFIYINFFKKFDGLFIFSVQSIIRCHMTMLLRHQVCF